MKAIALAALLLCAPLYAQKSTPPPPAPTVPADQLSVAEQLAIAAVSERQNVLQQQQQQLQQQINALLADIQSSHPGFHLQDGKLVANPAAETPKVTPAKK